MKEISLDDAYKKFEHHRWVMDIKKFLWETDSKDWAADYKQEFVNFGHFCDWLKQEGYAIV